MAATTQVRLLVRTKITKHIPRPPLSPFRSSSTCTPCEVLMLAPRCFWGAPTLLAELILGGPFGNPRRSKLAVTLVSSPPSSPPCLPPLAHLRPHLPRAVPLCRTCTPAPWIVSALPLHRIRHHGVVGCRRQPVSGRA